MWRGNGWITILGCSMTEDHGKDLGAQFALAVTASVYAQTDEIRELAREEMRRIMAEVERRREDGE